jgi:hypothetical protein
LSLEKIKNVMLHNLQNNLKRDSRDFTHNFLATQTASPDPITFNCFQNYDGVIFYMGLEEDI